MNVTRVWPIVTVLLGLVTLGLLLSFNLLSPVANVYALGDFGPAMSAFQRATKMDDLLALFGNPPDPAILAAMTAGNQLDLFGFIPAYTLFLFAASITLTGDAKQPLTWVAILLAVIGAVADVQETAAQLGVTTEWSSAERYLPYIASTAWMKFFALAAHALICGYICYLASPRRWIVCVLSVVPILGVLVAAAGFVRIPSMMTTVFGVFWIALLVVAARELVRPNAAPAKDAAP